MLLTYWLMGGYITRSDKGKRCGHQGYCMHAVLSLWDDERRGKLNSASEVFMGKSSEVGVGSGEGSSGGFRVRCGQGF